MPYVVASPGRTGSIFLVTYLDQYLNYYQNRLVVDEKQGKTNCYVTVHESSSKLYHLIPSQYIVHCHNAAAVETFVQKRQLIIITRNLIDIVASYMIAAQTKCYHFVNDNELSQYIEKFQNSEFYLDPFEFVHLFEKYKNWYLQVLPLRDKATIFTYKQAIDKNEFIPLLDLDANRVIENISVKPQPFDKWNKISNAKSIIDIGLRLHEHCLQNHSNIFTKEWFDVEYFYKLQYDSK